MSQKDNARWQLPTPPWVRRRIRLVRCCKCGAPARPADLVSIGARRGANSSAALAFETRCHRCGEANLCLFPHAPLDPRAFSAALAFARRRARDSDGDGAASGLVQPRPIEHWFDERAHEEREQLKRFATHEDFLRAIGVTQAQYDQWLAEGGGDPKKNPDSTKE